MRKNIIWLFYLLLLSAHAVAQEGGNVLKPMTDDVRRQTNVDFVQRGQGLSSSYKGKGVLIGIVDTGFDFTHPNFKDKDGKCRILSVWDQNGFQGTASEFGYGVVYNSPEQIAQARHDNSMMSHGTHVAGIAAGSADTPYFGMAPEASLVMVSTNQSEQGIVDGVDYLLRYARQVGMPIVVNVSLGTMMGFKDGTGLMARKVDSLLNNQPGFLMAVAAGNEGNRMSTLTGNNVKSVWKVPTLGADQLFVEARPDEVCNVELTLRNTKTDRILFTHTFTTGEAWKQTFQEFGSVDRERSSLVATCVRNEVSGAFAITLNVGYTVQSDEEWVVSLSSSEGTAVAYANNGSFISGGHEGFSAGSTASTLAMTATGRFPIIVGATVSKNSYTALDGTMTDKGWPLYERYPLSALGPTSDGRIKPDVVAPGAAVVSSYNSYAAQRSVKGADVVYKLAYGGKDYYWYVESGTSMATPAVTGILALWLQACPTLTLNDVREILDKTSVRSKMMGQIPNNAYGRGQIDAQAGLKLLLEANDIGKTSLFDVSTSNTAMSGYLYDSATHTVTTQGPKGIRLYSLEGQLMLSSASRSLDITRLPVGIYVIRLANGATAKIMR